MINRMATVAVAAFLVAGCGSGSGSDSVPAQGAQSSRSGAGRADVPGMVVWLQGNGLPPYGDYQLTSADGAPIGKVTVDEAYRGVAWNEDKKLCFAPEHHPEGAGCYVVTKRARDGFNATNDKGAEVKFTPIAK